MGLYLGNSQLTLASLQLQLLSPELYLHFALIYRNEVEIVDYDIQRNYLVHKVNNYVSRFEVAFKKGEEYDEYYRKALAELFFLDKYNGICYTMYRKE